MTTVGAVLQSIVSGKSVQTLERPAQDGEYGILKVSAVTWGEFRPQQNKAMPADYEPGECPRPMDGDILISRANTRDLVGAPVLVRGDHPHLLLSDKILKLIPNRAVVDREYLVRALRFPAATAHFFKSAGGSSGSMTNITQGDIRSAPIPLPPLEEQRRIAAILDQAETLRTQRRQALAHLDTLTQSLFLDMFGDPAADTSVWPKTELDDVAGLVTGYAFRSEEYVGFDQGIKLCRGVNVLPGRLDWRDMACWPHTKVSEVAAFQLLAGDIVMAMDRPWISEGFKLAQVEAADCPMLLVQRVARIRPKSDVANEYLFAVLSHVAFTRHCKPTETTVPHISPKDIRSFAFQLPPLALQQTFATRIQAIEALKVTHRTALAQLDALFASLQQRAFAGEL
jgi:type I restriction enzyme S subunit